MLRLTILSVLIALAVARTPRVRPIVPMLDGRIVGGELTTIDKVPYQLSLQSWGNHICGASIISPTKALTAAHCTYGSSAASLSVRAGSSYRGGEGVVAKTASICQHPRYNPSTIDFDVSVLRLSSSLQYTNKIQPIPLVGIGQPPNVGTLATVSGWGTTSAGGSSSYQLQKVEVPRVSRDVCRQKYQGYLISERMICFGYAQGGKDSCQGDSGGPLVTGGRQVGIVSWGIGCASSSYPGVYADVSTNDIRNHILSC